MLAQVTMDVHPFLLDVLMNGISSLDTEFNVFQSGGSSEQSNGAGSQSASQGQELHHTV
jgi:hypothetical protein